MKRSVCLLLSLTLLCGLSACGSRPTKQIQGLVTEVQTSPEGKLLSFLVQPEEGEAMGVLLRVDSHVSPSYSLSGTPRDFFEAFQEELQPDAVVSALCLSSRKTFTAQDGREYSAYEAQDVSVIGHMVRGGATLNDGTALDVLEGGYLFTERTYYLPGGVKLLSVSTPSGPVGSHVMGQESLDDLNGAAQEKVAAYYADRGLLYDETAQLELAYAHQKTMGESFSCHYLDQNISPSASSPQVMYFLTTVSLPTDHGDACTNYELRLGDAFDRETGEHLDPRDLFACPWEEALVALLKAGGVSDGLRSEMEAAFAPERIVLFPDSISVNFERGSLPSQDHDYLLSVQLADLPGLLRDWAIPLSAES